MVISPFIASLQALTCVDTTWEVPKAINKPNADAWKVFFIELFSQRNQWYQQFKERHPNLHLSLPICTLSLLQGFLAALKEQTQIKTSFNKLSISNQWQFSESEFEVNFKAVIQQLAEKGLDQLYLIEEAPSNFSETVCEKLTSLVESSRLSIEIILPERYQSSEWQKRLDQHAWTNPTYSLSSLPEITHKLPKRTHLFQHQAAVEIDVSLDQHVEYTQTVVNTSTPEVSSSEESDLHDTILLDWDQFKQKFDRRALNLLPEDYLRSITKEDWNNWIGLVLTLEKQPIILGALSQSACEQLIRAYPQFQFGFDHYGHLPAGFLRFKTKSNVQNFIHYDQEKALPVSIDHLAVQCCRPAYPIPLSLSQVNHWYQYIQNLKILTAAEKFSLSWWKQLEKLPYDREATRCFRQHLPKLLRLSEVTIQALIPILQEADSLHFKRLDFLFRHLPAIQSLPSDESVLREQRPAAYAVLTEQFGLKLSRILVFSKQYVEENTSKATHKTTLLYCLLQQDQSKIIRDQLDIWTERLSLSPQNLDALLPIHTQYGPQGLARLFACWEDLHQFGLPGTTVLMVCHQHLFSKFHSYLPLLEKDYQEALKTLKGFYIQPAQGHWWERLFQLHCETVGIDHLPHLVNAFQEFSRQITALGLNFYKPCQFEGIRSLPVALSRMLSLLQHCPAKHRLGQWQCITKLDLGRTGAVLATLSHPLIPRYNFITPEIRIQSDPTESNQALVTLDHQIAKEFHSCGLGFYQSAKDILQQAGFEETVCQILINALIKSTTGIENQLLLSEETDTELLKQLKNLCENINKRAQALKSPRKLLKTTYTFISSPRAILKLQSNFLKLLELNIPPLNILCTMLEDIISWDVKDIVSFVNRHEDAKTVLDFFGKLSYIGLQFQKTHQDQRSSYEEYNDYCNILLDIYKAAQNSAQQLNHEFSNPFFQHLGPLIYIFQLKKGDVSEIKKAFIEAHQNKKLSPEYLNFLKKSIQHLHYMKTNKDAQNQTLNPHALNRFLQKVYQQIEIPDTDRQPYKKLIETHFSAYYAAEFFETLLEGQLSSALQHYIASQFNLKEDQENITKCLLHFPDADEELSKKTVLLIKSITDHLSLVDRQNFLKQLSRPTLYHEKNLSTLNQLLSAILLCGHTHAFEYFIHHVQKISSSSAQLQNVLLKALIYQTLCHLRTNHKYAIQDQLDTKDQLLLIVNLVLALPICEFNSLVQTSYYEDISLRFNHLLEKLNTLIARYSAAKNLIINQVIHLVSSQNSLCLGKLEFQIQLLTESLTQLNSLGSVLSLLNHFTPSLSNSDSNLHIDSSLIALLQSVSEFDREEIDSVIADYPQNPKVSEQNRIHRLPEIKSTTISQRVIASASKWFSKFSQAINTIKSQQTSFSRQFSESDLSDSGIEEDSYSIHSESSELPKDNQGEIFQDALSEIAWSADWRKTLLSTVSYEKIYSNQTFAALCTACKSGSISLNQLKDYWRLPPHPSISQVLTWSKTPNPREAYQHFHLTPTSRNNQNGFNFAFALEQAKKFTGYQFSILDLKALKNFTEIARNKMPVELLRQLTSSVIENDPPQLIAVLAELLYRSNSQSGEACEINTTQYLTLLAILRTNQSVFMEKATGEGKSRVFMIMAACQQRLGGTIDFLTSDFDLARRDYQTYQPFFQMLSIPTVLIQSKSPHKLYQKQAIHFSTVADLSLFHNTCLLQNQHSHFPKDRILLLDEADRALFDTQTKFNLSKTQPKLKNLAWIYLKAMQFIKTPHGQTLASDPNADWNEAHEAFKVFADANRDAGDQSASTLSITQLDRLLEAAILASRLVLYKDFTITSDVFDPISDRLVSMAHVIDHNQKLTSSRYAEGVQECLHAALEEKRIQVQSNTQNETKEISKELYTALKNCGYAFPSNVEAMIVYSSTSQDLWKPYSKRIGITGTIGQQLEQKEARYLQMNCIKVPPHRPNQRIDHPIYIAANEDEKLTVLFHAMLSAQRKNQPVLVICQDDVDSLRLQTAILLKNQSQSCPISIQNFQRIEANLIGDSLDAAILKAGDSGIITFTTDRLGRGTDIRLTNLAKQHGLLVLVTYLASSRDDRQIRGRAGRQGVTGESRCILTASELEKLEGFSKTQFYQNPEKYFEQIRQKWDLNHQAQRLKIDSVKGKLFSSLQTTMFRKDKICSDQERANINKKLNVFVEQVSVLLKQNNLHTLHPVDFLYALKQIECDAEIKTHFEKLDLNSILSTHQFAIEIDNAKPLSAVPLPIFHEYCRALDGRAKVYDQLFVETRATLRTLFECLIYIVKLLFYYIVTLVNQQMKRTVNTIQPPSLNTDNMRLPCANTRAYLDGRGDIWIDSKAVLAGERPLFANTRATFRRLFKLEPKTTQAASWGNR